MGSWDIATIHFESQERSVADADWVGRSASVSQAPTFFVRPRLCKSRRMIREFAVALLFGTTVLFGSPCTPTYSVRHGVASSPPTTIVTEIAGRRDARSQTTRVKGNREELVEELFRGRAARRA